MFLRSREPQQVYARYLLLTFLATFFGGIIALNYYIWHTFQIWQPIASTAGVTAIALTITLFIHYKSKNLNRP